MARRYGDDGSIFQSSFTTVTDSSGVPLINTGNDFGSSPLGISMREQIQFGLPNASFNLLPPEPASPILDFDNQLPYWSIQTTPNLSATCVFDTATQTWGIKMDPGTAPADEYMTLKTRSWVTTDDNLQLRQKASLTASKNGTYSGATQWNASLIAEYFDHANASLGSVTIGTVSDNTAGWTGISGFTTAGGSAIPSTAAWAEFTIKLTTTAAVTSSTSITLKSLLLATSSAALSGFLVIDKFYSSGTWTRPTGVDYLTAVVAVGAGGGGGGGGLGLRQSSSAESAYGGAGGGGAPWILVRDIYVGGTPSVSVGIGAGGNGGTAKTVTKPAGTGGSEQTGAALDATNGAAGGATTFGPWITVTGGSGGAPGNAPAPGSATAPQFWDIKTFAGGSGGQTFTSVFSTNAPTAGASVGFTLQYSTAGSAGASGGNVVFTVGGTAQAINAAGTGAVGGSAGVGGGGGVGSNGGTPVPRAGAAGGGGGGGGAVKAALASIGTVGTVLMQTGNGGSAGGFSGAGGGGGGAAMLAVSPSSSYTPNVITVTSGSGGKGGDGAVYVVYVAG